MHVNDLITRRNTLHADMQAVLDTASAENRNLSAEEAQRYDALEADFDRASTDLRRAESAAAREAALRSVEIPQAVRASANEGESRNMPRNASPEYREAFGNWLRTGETRLNGAALEQRAMGIATGAGGGFLVPSGFYNTI